MQNERTNVIDLNLRLFIVRIAPKTFAKIMQCVSFLSPRIYLTFKKNILGAKNCSLYTLLTYIGAVWKIGSKNLKKIKLFELQSIPRKNTICLKKELLTYLLANTNLIWDFKITTWLRTQNKQTINSFKHRTKQFGQKNRNVKKREKCQGCGSSQW